jgi:DNA-binding PadR family transcriptional regulator
MKSTKPSPLGLAVLALLVEAPMHPYRMQQLIKARGKDEVINVRLRNSLYQTIERLQRDGLVTSEEVERQDGKPDRTVYAVTPAGRQAAVEWLGAMLADVGNEFPGFPAALSFLGLITPAATATLLEGRRAILAEREIALLRAFTRHSGTLPRVFLLENEYQIAVVRAERQWLVAVLADLRSGALDWAAPG